jgi:hypothetical protein
MTISDLRDGETVHHSAAIAVGRARRKCSYEISRKKCFGKLSERIKDVVIHLPDT